MKTILKYLLGLVAILLIAGAIVFFFFPGKIIDWTNASYASGAGVTKKTLSLNGETVHYFASEDADRDETVVLVHGLGDDKNSFLQSAAGLREDYNLILPDLQGHGANSRNNKLDYSIAGQVAYLHALLQELKVTRFHLVGNSMGGHLSAAYALKYPAEVSSLVLVNAPGITLPDAEVYTGFGEPLETKEDLANVMKRIMHEPPSLPGPIANHMIEQVNAGLDFTDNVMIPGIKGGEDFDLTGRLAGITAPTLILWGEHDPVVDYRVAEYMDEHIPLSRIQVLPNASHSPQLEHPAEVAAAITNFLNEKKATMIQSQKNTHAAKAQLYRWYTLYERELSQPRIANQLDILTEDVKIVSAAGEMQGRANYPARLAVYKGWKNAHHVEQVSVKEAEDGRLNLEADITYQVVKPDGEENRYTIHYNTFLTKNGEGNLPHFEELNLQPTGQLDPVPFEDAYPTNRMTSLMHYWLLNMEMLDGNVEPFREILADDFVLNFSTSSQLTTIAGLEEWLNGTPKQLKISSHIPNNFTVKTLGDNRYEVNVDFNWTGETLAGDGLKATTRHKWLVVDDVNERFARIKQADVSQVVALGPL